jgi:hypothetical protein
MGADRNKRRAGLRVRRAQVFERLTRALSVERPEPAYICRKSFEANMKASRFFSVRTTLERSQISRQL